MIRECNVPNYLRTSLVCEFLYVGWMRGLAVGGKWIAAVWNHRRDLSESGPRRVMCCWSFDEELGNGAWVALNCSEAHYSPSCQRITQTYPCYFPGRQGCRKHGAVSSCCSTQAQDSSLRLLGSAVSAAPLLGLVMTLSLCPSGCSCRWIVFLALKCRWWWRGWRW